MSGHDRQPLVEGNEALAVRGVDGSGGAEEGVYQVSDQPQAFVVEWRGFERRVEAQPHPSRSPALPIRLHRPRRREPVR